MTSILVRMVQEIHGSQAKHLVAVLKQSLHILILQQSAQHHRLHIRPIHLKDQQSPDP